MILGISLKKICVGYLCKIADRITGVINGCKNTIRAGIAK